ncbi:MAG: hypothetical protein ABEI13_01960, partial [Candidatus Paceibacteria bacterium]
KAGESYDDVLRRLLTQTQKEVTLEEVIDTVWSQFEYVACIVVFHIPYIEYVSELDIKVYTGEADGLEDYLDLYGPEYRIVVEDGKNGSKRLPFNIMATCGGPQQRDGKEATTIYMDDSVIGAVPTELDEGLENLTEKLLKEEH